MSFLTDDLVQAKVNIVTSAEPSSSNTGQLLNWEAKRDPRVVSICGVGGIGKTFLANEIFHRPEIRRSYDAFAWASISQPCQISAVQQELLSSLASKSREQIAQMSDDELKEERRKKCFIVLDGFWDEQLWEQLKGAFPITCHRFRSKILLTCRLEKVAKYVHDQALFSEEYCQRKALDDWKDLKKNFSSFSIDREDEPWKIILDLSYYELPYQLKPCFLYLGYFPTNLKITTTKLSRLWEAEGLVSSDDNEESEETLEDVAESCLAELVERSLVQGASRDLGGRAKTCRLHDVMQKLCMDKAIKLNWLKVIPLGKNSDQPSGTSSKSLKSSRSTSKNRRFAIYCTDTLDKLPFDDKGASYVRSLLFFSTLERGDVLIPLKKMVLKSTFKRYKLLRVVDIENIGLSSLPSDVGYLIHLRGSWVSQLPSSIKHLRCLQTLDLRVLSFVRLRIPNVLCNLERLVHLYLPAKPFILRKQAPKLCLKGLNNLETLSNFSDKCKADDVATLTNLREFSSCNYLYDPDSILPLLGSPNSALVHLDHISVMLESSFLSGNPGALASCKALHKLWIRGILSESIRSIMLPNNIAKLTFSGTEFLEDPMPVLEKLPHLKQLSLKRGSYKGTHMSCSAGGFKELCYLELDGLEDLIVWTVEKGAMPKLFSLEISRCHKLQMIPDGFRSVGSLEEVIISYMPWSFFGYWTPEKSLDEWHEYQKVEHYVARTLQYYLTYPCRTLDTRTWVGHSDTSF
ncbi:hypothetical protein RND81_01G050700 [Saponaria officinalis]|uniref:NB-ARC domain-containing protein n=1 Tax=Saponaria officinalis TaxID=3572 RepID=A0AAW1N8W3_SAPOF